MRFKWLEGTCKHIERVFQVITHRRKVKFREATGTSGPVDEIFVDTTLEPPRLRRQVRRSHEYLFCKYEQIRIDVDEINSYFAPDLIVLDEAQRIKNWPTKTAKTIKRLQSPYAFVLTGTPLENRVQELYSLAEFVDPHLFGTLDRFNREFMRVSEDEKTLTPRDLHALHRRISAIMLRRRKSDIADALPEREEKFYRVPMTDEQQLRYDDYEYKVGVLVKISESRKLTKEEMERLQMLLACMRMICDTPYILDKDCRDCPKLEELTDLLDEVLDDPDAKILIFSEWVRMLDLVSERLDTMGIGYTEHTGKIPQKQRREHIRKFKQDPECRVLLSSESGGVGLNLQNANIVINLDLPWNPAKLEQRIARAWRKHQKRSVRVLNLVTSESIEERMINKLACKTALADSVLDGADFRESLEQNSGGDRFMKRLQAVMGAPKPDAAELSAEAPPAKSSATSSATSSVKATLTDALLSRHGNRIRGIEQSQSGITVVVAEPGAGRRDLEDTARRAASGRVEVISTETLTAIRRLQQLGLLTLTGPLETRHAADGYETLTVPPPAEELPLRYPQAAQNHWRKAEGEHKAAKALADLGMFEQVHPHLLKTLENAKESISIYFTSKPEVEKNSTIPPEGNALLHDMTEWRKADPGPDACRSAFRLCKDVERMIAT